MSEPPRDSTVEIHVRMGGPAVPLTPSAASRLFSIDVQWGLQGRTHLLGPGKTIGSGRTADIRIDDPTVSARHIALEPLGSGVSIKDLGSKNGTYVGNARITEAWVLTGTTITIGTSSVTVRTPFVDDEEEGEPLPGIAGSSHEMRRLAAQVRRTARYGAPVLILGENGSGKELVARALHTESQRRSAPFVALNVASLPKELAESELFGHERGAFTGAVQRKIGAFAEAELGTLFLDEIGDFPLELQPKLLRALDGYEVRRVGATGVGATASARIVAATHRVVEALVLEGRFRRDLFHRLEAFVIRIPPLRERRGDIGPIARDILRRHERDVGTKALTPAATAKLSDCEWPGNVRELRNVLLRAADVTKTPTIDAQDIDRVTRPQVVPTTGVSPNLAKAFLDRHAGNLSRAARAAGIPRTTFRKIVNRQK